MANAPEEGRLWRGRKGPLLPAENSRDHNSHQRKRRAGVPFSQRNTATGAAGGPPFFVGNGYDEYSGRCLPAQSLIDGECPRGGSFVERRKRCSCPERGLSRNIPVIISQALKFYKIFTLPTPNSQLPTLNSPRMLSSPDGDLPKQLTRICASLMLLPMRFSAKKTAHRNIPVDSSQRDWDIMDNEVTYACASAFWKKCWRRSSTSVLASAVRSI